MQQLNNRDVPNYLMTPAINKGLLSNQNKKILSSKANIIPRKSLPFDYDQLPLFPLLSQNHLREQSQGDELPREYEPNNDLMRGARNSIPIHSNKRSMVTNIDSVQRGEREQPIQSVEVPLHGLEYQYQGKRSNERIKRSSIDFSMGVSPIFNGQHSLKQ